MLACGSCAHRGEDFPHHTQPGECAEGRTLPPVEFADRLDQTQHALLQEVLLIRAHEEIRARTGFYQPGIPLDQIFHCLAAALLRQTAQRFISQLGRWDRFVTISHVMTHYM